MITGSAVRIYRDFSIQLLPKREQKARFFSPFALFCEKSEKAGKMRAPQTSGNDVDRMSGEVGAQVFGDRVDQPQAGLPGGPRNVRRD